MPEFAVFEALLVAKCRSVLLFLLATVFAPGTLSADLLSYPVSATSPGDQRDEVSLFLEVKCRKNGTAGCTAQGEQCTSLRRFFYLDHGGRRVDVRKKYIVEGSIRQEVFEFWNLKPSCSEPRMTDFEVISGVRYPQGFCADLYVESGSGLGSQGKEARVKCRYTFDVEQLP